MLSNESIFRLIQLEKNAHKIYGKNSSRSQIIEQLIMNTGDPIQKIKERKRELAREITRLTELEEQIKQQKEE